MQKNDVKKYIQHNKKRKDKEKRKKGYAMSTICFGNIIYRHKELLKERQKEPQR